MPRAALTMLGCSWASLRLVLLVSKFMLFETRATMPVCLASSIIAGIFPLYSGSERWMCASTNFMVVLRPF